MGVVGAVGAVDVAVVGAVAETGNRKTRTDLLTRSLLVMNRLVRRGNVPLNLMVVRTQASEAPRYPWSGQRQKRPKQKNRDHCVLRSTESCLYTMGWATFGFRAVCRHFFARDNVPVESQCSCAYAASLPLKVGRSDMWDRLGKPTKIVDNALPP